jgi:hypothetical protein
MSIDAKTLTFAGLQSQVGEWSRKNFPNNTPADPFYGLVEEVGEFSHSILKARQGIRGTTAEHEAKEKDAIGDIVIYLADWCERNGLSLSDGTASHYAATYDWDLGLDSGDRRFEDLDLGTDEWIGGTGLISADRCFRWLIANVGEMAIPEPNEFRAGAILIDLAAYCHHREWNLAEIVAETWGMVSQRDWTVNKGNGQTTGGVV